MTIFGPYAATVVALHDGDTLSVDVVLARRAGAMPVDHDLGFHVHRRHEGIVLARQVVRLYGCNAPELKTEAGQAALAYILGLVKVGDRVTLRSHGVDKFGGRIDGSIALQGGKDLAAAMIEAGHAVVWDGHGPKPVPA